MTVSCPRCHKPLTVSAAGETVRCESCGKAFKAARRLANQARNARAGSTDLPPAASPVAPGDSAETKATQHAKANSATTAADDASPIEKKGLSPASLPPAKRRADETSEQTPPKHSGGQAVVPGADNAIAQTHECRNRRAAAWAAGGAAVGGVLVFCLLTLLGWRPPSRQPIAAGPPAPPATQSTPAAVADDVVATGGAVRSIPEFVAASDEIVISAGAPRLNAGTPATVPADTQVADAAPPITPVDAATSRPTTGPFPATQQLTGREPRPALRPMPIPSPDRVTDAAIDGAIKKGIGRLMQDFDPQTGQLTGVGKHPDALACGLDALCVYALMQAGIATDDPRVSARSDFMKSIIEGMKRLPADVGHTQVYAHGIRAAALATFNRPQDAGALGEDVGDLLYGHVNGAYGYGAARMVGPNNFAFDPPGWLDNSNSQYGLLGVWAGAEVGLEIPGRYWEDVYTHWSDTQEVSGTWSYNVQHGLAGNATEGQRPPQRHAGITRTPLAMTAAGLTSSLVSRDYLLAAKRDAAVGLNPYPDPIGRALRWWEAGDNSIRIPDQHWGYVLYGVERVGLASGLKYFGNNDWYRMLTAQVLQNQRPGGGWTRPDIASAPGATDDEQLMGDRPNTAFALLFLSRGRHPILMNKLRFEGGINGEGGHWANRPRDLAGLTRFVGRQLERQLNWQVVDLKHDWQDWADAPILYIASHEAPKFTESDFLKFRAYVLSGGMIFTQADGDSPSFTQWVERELVQKVLPKYEFRDVPRDHPLYASLFPMTSQPPLRMVTNGSRVLMLHSPKDVAISWQFRDEKFRRDLFELGANLFIYAAGRRDFRNRLDGTFVPAPPEGSPPTGQTYAVARLEYNGDWNPEPYAWIRFSRLFRYRTGSGVEARQVKLSELKPGDAPLAHLTGTARYRATDAEVAALKAYVEAGGVLFADHCGGVARFPESVHDLLQRAFPGKTLAPLPSSDPLLVSRADGMADLAQPKLRPYAADLLGRRPVALQSFDAGKGRVIVTKLDVTSGLLGTNTLPILGFAPPYAEALMQNLIFWSVDRAATTPTAPAAGG